MNSSFFKKKIFFCLFCVVFLSGCIEFIKDEDTEVKTNLSNLLRQSFPTDISLYVGKFRQESGTKDSIYLEASISEEIYVMLKDLEYFPAYIPFEKLPYTFSKELAEALFVTDSPYTNYFTVKVARLPEEKLNTTTNSNWIEIETNIFSTNLSIGQIDRTNYITNEKFNIQTNQVLTNYTDQEYFTIETNDFYNMISNEFPEVIESATYLPIHVFPENKIAEKDKQDTSNLVLVDENGEALSDEEIAKLKEEQKKLKLVGQLTGSYTAVEQEGEYTTLDIDGILEMDYSTFDITLPLSLEVPEYKFSTDIQKWNKPIRNILYNRPTGDVYIHTHPEGVNAYIGKFFLGETPLYYPAIPTGEYEMYFYGLDTKNTYISLEIEENKTNIVDIDVQKLAVDGIVAVNSNVPDAFVFFDGQYVGKTPLAIEDVTLDKKHRVKVISDVEGTTDYHEGFTLDEDHLVKEVDAQMYFDFDAYEKEVKAYWNASYAMWGLTLATIGTTIFLHYKTEYYKDLENTWEGTGNNPYTEIANNYQMGSDATLYSSIGFVLLATVFTTVAFYKEELQIGLYMDGDATGIQVAYKF